MMTPKINPSDALDISIKSPTFTDNSHVSGIYPSDFSRLWINHAKKLMPAAEIPYFKDNTKITHVLSLDVKNTLDHITDVH
jgi:hypothetical protein